MSDLGTIYQEAKDKQAYIINKCVVGQWAAVMDSSSFAAFTESLNDDDFSTRSLYPLYKKSGATFGLTSLREHRRGACACL